MSDVTIGFVGGGSRDWVAKMMRALALTDAFGGRVRLYDLDYESAKENEELGDAIQDHPDAVGDWAYEAVDSLAAALSNADFVLCSTQDPPAETFKHDLDVPQSHGIHQTVGQTVGSGGAFRALRSIPQYREIPAMAGSHLAYNYNHTTVIY